MITLQKYTCYYKGIRTNASTSLMYFTMNYMHITVCKTSISPQNIVLYRFNSVNGCVSNMLPMHSMKIFFGSTEGVTCMREVINAHNSHLRSLANPCATRTCGYKDYIRADMWAGMMVDIHVGTYLLPHQLQLNNMPGPLADMPLPV